MSRARSTVGAVRERAVAGAVATETMQAKQPKSTQSKSTTQTAQMPQSVQTAQVSRPPEHPLRQLMDAPLRATPASPSAEEAPRQGNVTPNGLVVGELLGFVDGVPLVTYPGQPGQAALRARTTVDLHGAHVGRQVALMFESADPRRPLVMGVLRGEATSPEASGVGSVEVDADGERLVVTAKDQLVLRCGASSITLTKAGKVLIQGKYISSRSSGVNRIKGGSVQIN